MSSATTLIEPLRGSWFTVQTAASVVGKCPKPWRMVAGALRGAMVLATLGFGEHYLVDLSVAVPFAMAVQTVGTAGLKWRTLEGATCATFGLTAVTGWLMYLRLPRNSSGATAWPWIVLLGGAVPAMLMESRLARVAARVGQGAEVPCPAR